MPVSLDRARGAASDGSAGSEPQKRLIALLDYIEQVEKLGRKPTFVVPTGYFCQYEEDLRGLPSLEFDCGGEGDDVWLRVPRLKEKDPPPPGDVLAPWAVVAKSPDKFPQLRPEITVAGTGEAEPPITVHLDDAPEIRAAFDAYVQGPWTAWADYERPRRKTIGFYNQLFKLEQVMEAEGVETPIELVWGIGMALWDIERSTHVRHPLITQAAEISLDPVSLALEVRPRDRLPTLEIDAYVALENPGVPSVEAAWKAMLEQAVTTISPFDESSFRTLLGAAVGYLDANGRYYPEVREDPEDRRLPKPAPELTIGFDWFIQLDWVAAALGVRAGKGSLEELNAQLRAAGLGKEALAKTQTKLNALVLEPRADLVDFIGRGVSLFASTNTVAEVAPFAWGAALAAYPYFGRVAEFTGRLTSIQGDCSVAEVHRRMSEVYGDREVTKRATQAVLQTQANWGAIARVEKGKRLVRLAARGLTDQRTVAWLIEAALRYQGKAMALATLQSTAVLYPFLLGQPLAYVVANSEALELRSEGPSQQFVALHAAI